MNRKIKYVSVLAAIPLLLVAFSANPTLIQDAAASAIQTANQYGLATQGEVCGDHLCNAQHTVSAVSPDNVIRDAPVYHAHAAKIVIEEVHNFRGSDPTAYIATLKITAGNANLEDIQIVATSDIDTVSSEVGGLFSRDDTTNVVRIHADDPSTIAATVTSYQISE
jgi:hypothetical protein